MYAVDPGRWVVKGGFALILRLDPSRTSNDVDVTYVHAAGEHAVALKALERAVGHDLGDFFDFEIEKVGEETEDGARRVTLIARLGAREFCRFRVDLALPTEEVNIQSVDPQPLVGLPEVDDLPSILVLAWPQQIADKVCAIFEQHGEKFSSRARDLADLAMIARQVDNLSGDELIVALRAEEARRRERFLPEGLPDALVLGADQEVAWHRSWAKSTRNVPISFEEALALGKALVDPLLDGSAGGLTWNSANTRYS